MKNVAFIFIFGILGTSLSYGQDIVEMAYFHDLRGFEDSADVTHLFYQMYHTYPDEYYCGENPIQYSRSDNNIIHYDTSTNQDSVLFEQFATEYCGGYNYYSIFDFLFTEKNPEKWIIGEAANSKYSIINHEGHTIEFYLPVPTKSTSTTRTQEYYPNHLFLNNTEDSLFVNTEFAGTLKFPGNGRDWPTFEDHIKYQNYTDSIVIDWDIIAQHPFLDSLYFALGVEYSDSSLYRSENSIRNFTNVSSGKFTRSIHFDGDSSHMYSLTKEGIYKSNSLGAADTWSYNEINFQTLALKHLVVDNSSPGELFLSDSTFILFSDNFAESFLDFLSVEDEITGLYKKPDSDILYVLTKEELLEVNTETKQTISLKQLPVSSERFTDVPSHITLKQNYPNPFNPTTVISYQLNSNQLVRLEVFDVMGRKVAVLVDGERKPAGNHRVHFDGSEFSSGVYFYRLHTGGQTLTRKMLLVK